MALRKACYIILNVTQETFRLRLEKVPPTQISDIESLAGAFRQEAAQAVAWVAEQARTEGARGDAARLVLAEIGDAAWRELIRGLINGEAEVSGWHLSQLGRSVTPIEHQILAGLRKSLADRRPVPIPPGFELAEEVVPEQRICDLAYLGLRRNLAPETELIGLVASDHFSKMPELERNHEIVRFAQTGKFTALDTPAEEKQ